MQESFTEMQDAEVEVSSDHEVSQAPINWDASLLAICDSKAATLSAEQVGALRQLLREPRSDLVTVFDGLPELIASRGLDGLTLESSELEKGKEPAIAIPYE